MKDLQEIRVVKTVKIPSVTSFLLKIKRFASSLLDNGRPKVQTANWDMYGDNFDRNVSESFLQKVKRYYISFCSLPDSERGWVIPAAVRAVIEIRRGRFDSMLTTSPPHSSHLIGLIVKKLTNVGWVADFRDPWIDLQHYKAPRLRTAITDAIECWLEQKVMYCADKIITTTEEHRRAIMSRFPAIDESKFIYIPNSIDIDKYHADLMPERFTQFTISYAGTLYLNRSPEPLFKAICKLITSDRVKPSEIKLKLFGNCELIDGKPLSYMIKDYGLDAIVEVSGPIPLIDAIQVMQRSHLLLLLVTAVQSVNIPAKIYDYFGSGTKIIAITEDGATSELIKATNSGVCFSPSNIDGIAEYIFNQCMNKNKNHVRNDTQLYTLFDIKMLTEKLARELSSLQMQI
jgi:glycosyltransferase involved in cell wall biosynthesis